MLCRMWQKGDEEGLNEQGIYKMEVELNYGYYIISIKFE